MIKKLQACVFQLVGMFKQLAQTTTTTGVPKNKRRVPPQKQKTMKAAPMANGD
jgi:hypothetical protein